MDIFRAVIKDNIFLGEKEMEKREQWSSRLTFILAAIGSAVGLGNAWRFPGLAAKHGGGTFLLVYLAAMVVMGIPLLMMEIAIARKFRKGAIESMRGIGKRWEPIGWAATSNAFVIVCCAAQLASIRQMSGQVSRGSAGEYQADEQAGVPRLRWRVSGR